MPLVSIVMATYLRPQVLRWALESVANQTLTDWELLVVGDACGAETEALVRNRAERDPRIQFINLPRNFGEQSGPNNVGISRATGRYLAFLNQDDLWFPDHLEVLVHWLEASGADFVFAQTAHFPPLSADELHRGAWTATLEGLGRNGNYDPLVTMSPASGWLLKRSCSETVGPWRCAGDSVTEPSQDFLFRAWHRGFRLIPCPELTTLIFSSGARKDSYLAGDDQEQAFFHSRMSDAAGVRAQVLHRSSYQRFPMAAESLDSVYYWLRPLLLGVARLGIQPRALQFRKRGIRKGAYINQLRRIRGLREIPDKWALPVMQAEAVQRSCGCAIGAKVDFSAAGDAERYQLDGWCQAEAWGTWTCARESRLLFSLTSPLAEDCAVVFSAHAFVAGRATEQRIEILVNGQPTVCYRLTDNVPCELRVPVAREAVEAASRVEVTLLLPNATSPRDAGISDDSRRLGLGVTSVVIGLSGARQAVRRSE